MTDPVIDTTTFAKSVAYQFSEFYERREELRWALGDIAALVSKAGVLREFVDELVGQHGISVTLQTLKNYARVSKSFEEEHRHLQYKWSNFLEWSKWEYPVEAMITALDHGYSPTQMARLRRYGDPEYKKPKPELCQVCGGDVGHCRHEAWTHLGPRIDLEPHYQHDEGSCPKGYAWGDPETMQGIRLEDDEGQTRRVVQRDEELPSPKEDRQEATSPPEEVWQ